MGANPAFIITSINTIIFTVILISFGSDIVANNADIDKNTLYTTGMIFIVLTSILMVLEIVAFVVYFCSKYTSTSTSTTNNQSVILTETDSIDHDFN